MTDAVTRAAERAAATGDPEAAHAAIRALVRRGAQPGELMRWLPSGYEPDGDERLPFDRGYIGWAPGYDCMPGPSQSQHGWSASLFFDTWPQARCYFDEKSDVDLNLCVDFYFDVRHDTAKCPGCAHSNRPNDGLSDLGRRLRREAGDPITSLDWFRAGEERHGDAILCAGCKGDGEVRTGPDRLVFHAWLLHPRKGASRGVTVKQVRPEELDDVRLVLRRSWERLSTIWAWVRT